MLSLPLTIGCLVALLSIRLTVCGDRIIWATIDAEVKFMEDGVSGRECPLPDSFQMRANGSWLPPSDYELAGNFDENCAFNLLLTMPKDEPPEEKELKVVKNRISKLMKDRKDLREQEDKLSKENKTHEENMKKLKNIMESRDDKKNELNRLVGEVKEQNVRLDVIKTHDSLKEQMKKSNISDVDSAIESGKETEKNLTQRIADVEAKANLLNEYLNGSCFRIPTSYYLRKVNTTDIPSDAKVYLCHAKGRDYSKIIRDIWHSEINLVREEMRKLEDEELRLKNEKNLRAIRDEIAKLQVRKNDIVARKTEVEENKRMLGEYSDEDMLEKREKELNQENRRVNDEIKRHQVLLLFHNGKECEQLADADFIIVKSEVEQKVQNILVCGPQ